MFNDYKEEHENGDKPLLKEKSKAGRKTWKNPDHKYTRSYLMIRDDIKKDIKKLVGNGVGETQDQILELALIDYINKHEVN